MGRKKKFIDKKNAAVFHLIARETTEADVHSNANKNSSSDHVFVRVDNNPNVSFELDDDERNDCRSHDGDGDSMFADAPEGVNENNNSFRVRKVPSLFSSKSGFSCGSRRLPDHVRKEILELGLPDDGYNYLFHLRQINFSGGPGSSYYSNPKPRMDIVPHDVKAYDASKLNVTSVADHAEQEEARILYKVASKTVDVRVQKAVDDEVAKLLEDGELSIFGSDVEDLEEDFVAKAQGHGVEEEPEEEECSAGDNEEEEEECGVDGNFHEHVEDIGIGVDAWLNGVENEGYCGVVGYGREDDAGGVTNEYGVEKHRSRRLLDAQFDLLAMREYESDSDEDDGRYEDKETEALAVRLNTALKDYHVDDLELDDKYRVPSDIRRHDKESGENVLDSSSAEIIRKCAEYAEMYSQEDQDSNKVVIYEESSDESEMWDCETIVSTFSTLDNHPGKIQAPGSLRKRPVQLMPKTSGEKINVITLKGKESIPADYLPNSIKVPKEKMKKPSGIGLELSQKKRSQDESKEEKKERKVAVKEEKREARRAKKELKSLYRCEAQRAQKVAAFSGPSSVHLM